jgi:MFS transporter, FSR family, fosmidomycin resistance protein
MTVGRESAIEQGKAMDTGGEMDRTSLALLGLCHAFDDISQGALPAMLPFFIAAHDLSYSAAAGLVMAVTVSSSVLQPLLGQFSDRHSAPWLMPTGLFLAGAGIALASLMPSYLLIALAFGLMGIGVAAFHPEAARFANRAAGSRKATGMSVFSLGGNIGFAVGPLMATPLMLAFGLHGGILLALPATVMAGIIATQMPRLSAKPKSGAISHKTAGCAGVDAWGPFLRLTGTVISRSILFFGMNTFIPLYWRDDLRQSPEAAGMALTILFATGAVGTLLGGWLADRYGRKRVVVVSMTAAFLLMAVFVSIQDPTLAMLMLMPIGLAVFAPSSVMVVMGQGYLPNRIGTASGVTMGLAVSVGGMVAPLLGRVADDSGIQMVLTLLVFVPLVAAAFAVTLPRDKRPA